MDFQEYVTFANQNPECYISTTDGTQPKVRPVLMWFADDTGFYFQTQTVKAFCKQLKNNQKVEVCFHAPGPGSDPGKVMRITGEVEFIDDLALKSRCLEERHLLKDMGIVKPEDPLLFVFRIHKGEAFFWTREWTMRESEIERIRFGG